MNVVVDEQVAVLKVLALADAVGGDEQVDLLLLIGEMDKLLGPALGDGREVGQDVVMIGTAE